MNEGLSAQPEEVDKDKTEAEVPKDANRKGRKPKTKTQNQNLPKNAPETAELEPTEPELNKHTSE